MGKHAKLSPSAAHRWMHCPGCIRMCAGMPYRSSDYARKGTAAHMLGERCIEVPELNPSDMLGQKIEVEGHRYEIDLDMADAVSVYVDEIRRVRASLVGGIFETEQWFDLSWLSPNLSGTADHVAVEPLSCLYVHDYKNGYNIVEVEGNPQFRIYALGALGKDNPHMVEEVEVVVVQPNAPHSDGRVRRERMDVEALYKWAYEILQPAAKAALAPDAPVIAGDWCRWCDANTPGKCPAVGKEMDELLPVQSGFSPEALTGEQIGRILEMTDAFKARLNAVWVEAERRVNLATPDAPMGWKLVEGRSTRRWVDEDIAAASSAIAMLGDAAYTRKLNTPAQMEKILKKAGYEPGPVLSGIVDKAPGRPTLVPVTDKRPALPPSVEQMFPDEDINPLN